MVLGSYETRLTHTRDSPFSKDAWSENQQIIRLNTSMPNIIPMSVPVAPSVFQALGLGLSPQDASAGSWEIHHVLVRRNRNTDTKEG